MNILKKASLLTSLMLGMLLFSAHTTDNIFDPGDGDFEIVLDASGPRPSNKCGDSITIGKNPAATVNSVKVTVYTPDYFLREVYYANPNFNYLSQFTSTLSNLYQGLPLGLHYVIFEVEINTPNGSTTLNNIKFVYGDTNCQ